MYEFDEERWDEQGAESGDVKGIVDGWLIQSMEAAESRIVATEAIYLQIGTGQWCSSGAPFCGRRPNIDADDVTIPVVCTSYAFARHGWRPLVIAGRDQACHCFWR